MFATGRLFMQLVLQPLILSNASAMAMASSLIGIFLDPAGCVTTLPTDLNYFQTRWVTKWSDVFTTEANIDTHRGLLGLFNDFTFGFFEELL